MKKVRFYSVIITESFETKEVSLRASYFTTLREARSYYRICVSYYELLQHISDRKYAAVELVKEYNEDDSDLIDCFSKNF